MVGMAMNLPFGRRGASVAGGIGLLLLAGVAAAPAQTGDSGSVDASALDSSAGGRVASKPIASISGDWNQDGALDGALLFTSFEGASLFVYFGGQDGSKRTSILARDLVWHGQGVAGQEAGLERAPDHRFVVTAQNTAIGRDRWSERLTLAYDKGVMRVVRYELTAYDTLDLEQRRECDLDLLSGSGVLNGEKVPVAAEAPIVEDWLKQGAALEACDIV